MKNMKDPSKSNLLDTMYNIYTFFIIIFLAYILGSVILYLTLNIYFKMLMFIGFLLPFFLIIFPKKTSRQEKQYGNVLVTYFSGVLLIAFINLFTCFYNSEEVIIDSISLIVFASIGAFYSKKIWDAYEILKNLKKTSCPHSVL